MARRYRSPLVLPLIFVEGTGRIIDTDTASNESLVFSFDVA